MAQKKFPTWSTDTITDIGNGDPSKADPGATKQGIGWTIEKPLLQTFNWLQNLYGHFITANNQVLKIAGGIELEVGQRVRVNNLAASATVPLPTSPIDGQWVEIGGQGKYSVFDVIVDGGVLDIMTAADTTCTLDEDGKVYRFYWDATANLWKIEHALLGGM